MRLIWILEKLNFKISRGNMPPDPLMYSRLWRSILFQPDQLCTASAGSGIVCNLPFEKQLFGHIHYCTEISEMNINLLPNTCNFHRNFRLIFFLHLSENAQKVHNRAFGARYYLGRTNSYLLSPDLLFPIDNTYYIILRILRTQ